MPKHVAITHADGKELTQREITSVLQALGRAKGKLPPIKYQYRPPVRVISPRETLYVIPKEPVTQAEFLYIQVQSILDQYFPGEYVAETL